MSRGAIFVFAALVKLAMFDDGQHHIHQRLYDPSGIDLVRGGFALGQGTGMDIGQKSFEPEGENADSTEKGGYHNDVHQIVVNEM